MLWKTIGIPAIELFVIKFEQIVNSIVLYRSDKSPRFRQSELKQSIVNYNLHYTHKNATHLHLKLHDFSALTCNNHYSSCSQRIKQHATDKIMYTSKSYSWENFYSEFIHHSNTGKFQNVNKMFGNAAHYFKPVLNHQYKKYTKSSSFVVIIGVAISILNNRKTKIKNCVVISRASMKFSESLTNCLEMTILNYAASL